MRKLDDKVKVFIVVHLACFSTPAQVKRMVQDEFKILLSLQALSAYDPSTVAGNRLSPELTALFEETRAEAWDEAKAVPVAEKAYRLLMLQRLINETSGGPQRAKYLEQARRETEGAGAKTAVQASTQSSSESVLPPYDLTQLTAEEIDTVERLLEKAALSAGDPGGASAAQPS